MWDWELCHNDKSYRGKMSNSYSSLVTSWCPMLTHWPRGDVSVILKVYFLTLHTEKSLWHPLWQLHYEIALRWMPQTITNKKSTLVQVMAWCRQATSHYLSQHWSMSSYGVTRPHWVNVIVCLACWAGNIQPLCYSILWFLPWINKQVWLW